MGTEEQDAIVGRLTRERKQLAQQAAFIREELSHVADGFGEMARIVNRRLKLAPQPLPIEEFPPVVVKYVNLEKLRSLMEEQNQLTEQWGTTSARLRDLGAE